jgi:hypothetical protein
MPPHLLIFLLSGHSLGDEYLFCPLGLLSCILCISCVVLSAESRVPSVGVPIRSTMNSAPDRTPDLRSHKLQRRLITSRLGRCPTGTIKLIVKHTHKFASAGQRHLCFLDLAG